MPRIPCATIPTCSASGQPNLAFFLRLSTATRLRDPVNKLHRHVSASNAITALIGSPTA